MSENYQWYPGHMTKARRAMQEDIKLVDLVIELIDARIPDSSRNPDIDSLAGGKSRIVLLNKADLADERVNKLWLEHFKEKGIYALALDSRNKSMAKRIDPVVKAACAEKIERNKRRGILNRPMRAMVVGIPNVGKSTFINSFSGRAVSKTGNKPGVTKGKQWVKLSNTLELLDTPGILWPKFEDEKVGRNLAYIGSMNDEILQKYELSRKLAEFLIKEYPGILEERYPVADSGAEMGTSPDGEVLKSLKAGTGSPDLKSGAGKEALKSLKAGSEDNMIRRIALSRHCLQKGGEPDIEKAACILLDDFRSGRIGKISMERP